MKQISRNDIKEMIQEAASEYVWGVKNPSRAANQYKIKVLKQVIKEELSAVLDEGASMKIPVEQYEDFKKRLEKFYTHFEKFSESMRYQLQSVYPKELKTSDPYSEEEDAKRKDRAKQIRGEFAKYNRQLGDLQRHLSDLLHQYDFKTEYWATQSVAAQRALALEEADEGAEVMAAIEDVPQAADKIAEKVRAEVEKMAEPSGLDPAVLMQAVAALITAD